MCAYFRVGVVVRAGGYFAGDDFRAWKCMVDAQRGAAIGEKSLVE